MRTHQRPERMIQLDYTTKKQTLQELPVNGREMRSIEFLHAFERELETAEKTMEQRLRAIPDGWRRFRLVRTQTRYILNAVYDTMPATKLWALMRTVETGELIMRPKPITKMPNEMIVRADDVSLICEAVIEHECSLCVKAGKEIKCCPLRQAMQRMATPYDVPRSGCEYAAYSHQSWED